jgi:NADH:ubiquinone reductase (H+-translocating)
MDFEIGTLPHVVILGAGFGGLNAALALRHAPCHVTVIDKNNYHLFQPLLYQVATAGLSPGEIAAPIRHILRGASNTEVVMAEVMGIDKAAKHVSLAGSQTIAYDFLIVATGARHSYFGHDEWASYAPGLKSIADATNIRRQILSSYEEAELEQDPAKRAALLTIVIVGGGPTGVEMAGSIAELAHKGMTREFQHFRPEKTRVILAEAGERILSAFSDRLSNAAKRELDRLGVEVRTRTRVQAIDAVSVEMNGEHISTNTVIWAAGVEASPASKWLGVSSDPAGRIFVDRELRLEGHPEIFVIGDTALALDEGGEPLPGLAPVAMQQGTYVGKQIARRLRGSKTGKNFHYIDKGMLATVGRAFAVAEIWKLRLYGLLAWLVWVFVHIMYLVGFRNRVLVLTEWAWAYLTFQRGVRLIVEDE